MVTGQSKALGFGVTPAELPATWAPGADVQIWTGTAFETMRPGVNTGTPANPLAWGPEVEFAARWRQDHPGETLYIVKSVKGSTGLAPDPNELDWSPHTGELFTTATVKLWAAKAALSAQGISTDLDAILWVQGEQDAISATKAAAYGANLADAFGQMRIQWGDADTPIVYARLGDGLPLPYVAEVQSAQDAVDLADVHAVAINTNHLPMQVDLLHFDGAGQLGLGDALYEAWTGLTPPAPPAAPAVEWAPAPTWGGWGGWSEPSFGFSYTGWFL